MTFRFQFKAGILCIFFLLSDYRLGYAQDAVHFLFENSGLQMGVFKGQTSYSGEDLNYSFRVQSRHFYSKKTFGELSISSGNISASGYRSRITPLEYRFGLYNSLLGFPRARIFVKESLTYSYLGLGLLYSRPYVKSAPDDPYIDDLDEGLTVSSFWDFEGGFAPMIPFGVGLEVPLEFNLMMNLNVGYNKTLTGLRFNDNEVPSGYWGISVGLRLNNRKGPEIRPEVPLLGEYTDTEVPLTELKVEEVNAADLTDALLSELNRKNIQFDILSSDIENEDLQWLQTSARLIELNPGKSLHIKGHASSTGTDKVNEMVSESRARSVWLALLKYGIAPERVSYEWFSDQWPIAENTNTNDRAKNRRVEFELRGNTGITMKNYSSGRDLSLKAGIPITNDITFEWLNFLGEEQTLNLFGAIAEEMKSDRELRLYVASVAAKDGDKEIYKELDKARSEKIKAVLVQMGVGADRILSFNPYKEPIQSEYKKHLIQGKGNQVLLLPYLK